MINSSRFTVKLGSGEYTFLDKLYRKYVNDSVKVDTIETEMRWNTYEYILYAFIAEGDLQSFDEFRYRVTGGENINEILVSIIKESHYYTMELNKELKTLESYISEDYVNSFF